MKQNALDAVDQLGLQMIGEDIAPLRFLEVAVQFCREGFLPARLKHIIGGHGEIRSLGVGRAMIIVDIPVRPVKP